MNYLSLLCLNGCGTLWETKKNLKFKNYLELIVLIVDCWFVFSTLAKKFHVSVQPCNIL